jgi:triosephosphate isomerase (TIM)
VNVATPVIAGNWKLNLGPAAARAFFGDFLPRVEPAAARTLVFFPPSLSLEAALHAAGGRPDVSFGVQNVYWEESGAFTGEISASLAREAGARYCLVGHSERRHVFGETDEETARKVGASLRAGLLPMLCVGETLDERDRGEARDVVLRQMDAATASLREEDAARLLVAYEPVWAIGTGRTASAADASEMHGYIHQRLERQFGQTGTGVPVLYGGSVKPGNAAQLLAAAGVDGLLVGGASLDPAGFAEICLSGT